MQPNPTASNDTVMLLIMSFLFTLLQMKSKELAKLKEEIRFICSKTKGKYRELIGWAYLPVFDNHTEDFLPVKSQMIPIMKAKGTDDESLWDWAQESQIKVNIWCHWM